MKIAKSSQNVSSLDELSLSDLCHQLSHDIGNPLTAIISYSSILEQAEHFSIPLEKIGTYASNISKETWRVSRLMEKFLLLVSRKCVILPFSPKDLQQRVEARYKTRYELQTLNIVFEGFDVDLLIPADIDQCCSILCEIALNSRNAQNHLGKSNPELLLRLFEDDHFFTFEAVNASPLHKKELSSLLNPGEKEFCNDKDALGIGLSAIACTMSRWNGFLEIEERIDHTTVVASDVFEPTLKEAGDIREEGSGSATLPEGIFHTRLFFPKEKTHEQKQQIDSQKEE